MSWVQSKPDYIYTVEVFSPKENTRDFNLALFE